MLSLFKTELSEREIKREISISIIISYITIIVSVLVNFFYTPFLLKQIGSSQYGIHSFAASIISWLSIITTALCSGYLKFATSIAEKDKEGVSKLNGIYFWFFFIVDIFVIVIGLAIAIAFWTGIIPLNDYTDFEKGLLPPCILLLTVNTFISIFVSYFSLYEAYKERFIWARLITLAQTVLNPAICIPLLLVGGNVIVVCAVQAGITLLNLVLLAYHAIRISKMKAKLKQDRKANKALITSVIVFSSFALLSTIATSINQSADKIILGIATRPENVTIYQLALSLVSYLLLFCSAVTNSLSTKLYKIDLVDKNETNNLFMKIANFQAIIALFIVGGFIACGKEFMIMWAGVENVDAYYIGVMLFIVNLFSFTTTSGEVVVKSRGYFKFEAIYYLIEAVTNVLVSLLLFFIMDRQYAIYACTIATVIIVFIFRWVGLSIFYKKKLNLPMGDYFFTMLKYIIVSFGAIVFAFAISKIIIFDSYILRFLLNGGIYAALFLTVVVMFERKSIKSIASLLFKRGDK